METLKLGLSLVVADEKALQDLERWLKNASVQVRRDITPPTPEELAVGRFGALSLAVVIATESTHLPPSVEEGLRQIHKWQQHHQSMKPVVHLTGRQKLDEQIDEIVRRLHLHIELREPEFPTTGGNPPATGAPPKP